LPQDFKSEFFADTNKVEAIKNLRSYGLKQKNPAIVMAGLTKKSNPLMNKGAIYNSSPRRRRIGENVKIDKKTGMVENGGKGN
jgi:hypothetical protein